MHSSAHGGENGPKKSLDCFSVEFLLLGESPVSRTELALLKHEKGGVIASAQLNYYTNGFKNFCRIERLFVRREYRRQGYGNQLLTDCLAHVRNITVNFDTNLIVKRFATDVKNARELSNAASIRNVDRIHLECSPNLESFYGRTDLSQTKSIQMSLDFNELEFSSLD